jgi:hypothetical protein
MAFMGRIAAFFGFFAVMIACEEAAPALSNDPVFFLNFEIDGQPKTWVAGDSGYYMFTKVLTAPSGIPLFEGQLTPSPIPNRNNFSIGLLAGTSNAGFDWDYWNQPNVKPLFTSQNRTRQGVDLEFVLEPQFEPGATPLDWVWRIEGPNTFFTTDSLPTIAVDIDNYPVYLVRLSVNYSNGCQDEITQRIDFRNLALRDNFTITPTNTNQLLLERQFRYTNAGTETLWFLGGNQVAVGASWLQNNPPATVQNVQMRVPVGGTEIFVRRDFMPPLVGQQGCFSFFDFQILPHPDLDFFQAQHVAIQYTDASGKQFNSTYNTQKSSIQLSDFKTYRPNMEGEPTVRFKIAGDLELTAADGTTITLKNLSGYLGVAYQP